MNLFCQASAPAKRFRPFRGPVHGGRDPTVVLELQNQRLRHDPVSPERNPLLGSILTNPLSRKEKTEQKFTSKILLDHLSPNNQIIHPENLLENPFLSSSFETKKKAS